MQVDDQLIQQAIAYAQEIMEDDFELESEDTDIIVTDYINGAMHVIENPLLYGLIKASIN